MKIQSTLYMKKYVDSTTSAAAFSSASAWMVYMALNNKWEMTDANGHSVDQSFKKLLSSKSISKQDVDKFLNSLDPSVRSTLEQLSNEMIKTSIEYGVACCHHTCNNINFNKILMQMSTLSAQEKQKYSEILANATLKDPIYKNDASSDSSDTSQGENGGESNSGDSSSAGVTSAGNSPSNSAEPSAKSFDPSANSNAQDSGNAGDDSGSKAHEIEKSSSKNIASSQSSTPALVIIAVIVLIILFGFGYIRNRRDE